jgi:phage virion morphogenesis protein
MPFTLRTDEKGWLRRSQGLEHGVRDATPLMRLWGEIAHASVTENFEVGGRPKWKRLSAVTIKMKGHNRPLIGKTGNLARITVQVAPTAVRLGTHPAARAYASIQQYGGWAGRNHKVYIPARPYMMLHNEDRAEMEATTVRYLKRVAA